MKYNEKNKPLVCMMTQSTCYKGTRKFTPKGILWHSTGANNPNLKRYVQPDDKATDRAEWLNRLGKNPYGNDWNHIDHQAGLNFWIGKLADGTVAAVQTMPWDYRPWGCGSGSKGSCNDTHIQFEICEDGLNDKNYWNAVYQEACEMTAYLCKMFGIDPKGTISYNGLKVPTIIDHTGSHSLGLGSNHGDIQHWSRKYGKSMENVRNDVAAILAGADGATPAPEKTGLTKGDTGDAVKLMQTMLISCGFSCGSTGADGDFGKNTFAGLTAFQSANGLTADGVYGAETKAALETAYAKSKATVVTPDDPEKMIWSTLKAAIGNDYGVAGLMGNLYAESALNPQNLQNNGNKALGMNDAEFTAAFDRGEYSANTFIHDGYGYGLAQWTYYSRKESLLNYAKAAGKSIGDLAMQLAFLLQEIKGYKTVWNTLVSATSVRAASDAVLTQYERPADQSEAVQVKRAGYGQTYFDRYAGKTFESPKEEELGKKLPDRTIHDITKENLSQVPASRGSNPIQFIVVHYLGVPNADNPYLYGGGYGGHYNVQRDGSVYKAADPRTAVVWHCGGGLQGEGGHTFHGICTNYNSIGIECGVCYTDPSVKSPSGDSDQWYFTTETQESLVWLVVKLMKEYGIGIDHVIRHYDVTGKICPNPYVKNNKTRTSWTWDEFLAKVKQQAGDTEELEGKKPAGTGCTASKLIAVAIGEIGYKEKASNASLDDKTANAGSANYTKYARDFDQKYPNWYNGKKNGYAWCDMFVDWCFLTAFGYENALRLTCQPEKSAGAGCTYSLRYYKNKGQFYTSGPKPGDQIFFGTSISDSSHTGIVEKVDNSKVYTIEGNTSDQVARRSYALSNSRILGYGRPAYDAGGTGTSPVTPAQPAITTKYYRVRKSWADKGSQIGAYTVFQNAVNAVNANPGYAAFDDNGNQVYPVVEDKTFTPYLVKISISDLNYRKGPSTSYASYGYIEPGVYTIVDEQDGWGLLKAYAKERNGWISLAYTKRI